MEGPAYLLLPKTEWPSLPIASDQVKSVLSSFAAVNEIKVENIIDMDNPFEKYVAFVHHYSGFHCLIRSLCYIFRVIKACLIKNIKEKKKFLQLSVSPLTVQERRDAENYVIKLVQKDSFSRLYDHIIMVIYALR